MFANRKKINRKRNTKSISNEAGIRFYSNCSDGGWFVRKDGFWNIERILASFLFLFYNIPSFLNRVIDSKNYSDFSPFYKNMHNDNVYWFMWGFFGDLIILGMIFFTEFFAEREGVVEGMSLVRSPKIVIKILVWVVFLMPLAYYLYSSLIMKAHVNLWPPPIDLNKAQAPLLNNNLTFPVK